MARLGSGGASAKITGVEVKFLLSIALVAIKRVWLGCMF
jgi:tetrahydromethanopterin S-methyltransferase subunit F